MRARWILVLAAAAARIAGCQAPTDGEGKAAETTAPARDRSRVYLTVNFEQGKMLRYRIASKRAVTLDWDPNAAAAKNRVEHRQEQMEAIIGYKPAAVDSYGVSTVCATVESISVSRSGGVVARSQAVDAVESATGKSFLLKVDARGRIVDTNELRSLIQEMGEKTFQTGGRGGRIKNPDMIGDFVAGVWFLWDGVATIPRPAEGLAIGQTWTSQLSVPTPMVMRKARDVTYRFNGIRSGPRGAAAVIESTYSLADSAPTDWPVPYSGRFRVAGTFGFLGPYEALSLEGMGEELYNMQAGRLEQRRQTYTMLIRASVPPMGIEAHPHITIEQTLVAELLEEHDGESMSGSLKSETHSKAPHPNDRTAAVASDKPF